MAQVHILRWSGGGSGISSGIHGVHSDYKKACGVAEDKNKKDRNWFHRLCGDRWVVQTYSVKE